MITLDEPVELIDRESTWAITSFDKEESDKEIRTVRIAKIIIKNRKLISVTVVQKDKAMFNIHEQIKLLEREKRMYGEGSIEYLLAGRDIEYLQTFNKDGMRITSFCGVKRDEQNEKD